jgi:HlyD family secretion protein
MRQHISIILTAALLLSIAMAVSSCKGKAVEKAVETPPVNVVVKPPTVGEIVDWFQTNAEVVSPLETSLSFTMGGKIVELSVKAGDKVSSGQVLAKVDTLAYEKQLDAANNGVDAAGKQAEAARLGASAAKSQVATAQAGVDQAERDFNRMKKLHDEGVATQSEFERAELGFTSAKHGLQAAKDGAAAAEAQAQAAMSGIQSAKDGVAQVAKMVADGTLRAPYSGRIVSRMADLGAVAGPGSPIYVLVADSNASSRLEVRYKIPESVIGKVTIGMPVSLRLLSLDKTVELTVDTIGPEIGSGGRAVDVVSYIEADSLTLLPGMFGTIRLPVEKRENAFILPEEAVVELADAKLVYIAQDGKAVRRDVKTGIRSEGMVEILEGITANDQVIVIGNRFLADGAKIAISDQNQNLGQVSTADQGDLGGNK